jgi:hypothetical protein
MFEHTRRVHTLLAGAAGVTLVLGLGVAAGAVPRPVSTENASPVHAAAAAATSATGATATADPTPADAATTLSPTTDAPTTAPASSPTTAAKAAKQAAQADVASAASTPDAGPATTATSAPATAPAPAATSGIAPRINPTDAQVQAAIQQIATRIPFFSVANVAQARQFGDAVCSAFDSGASYSSVKSQVQSALSQLPMVTIKPTDMDFAIRTAVQLFCPGYMSKLG